MTLFYISNAGPEPLKPLSRKFRVREISPTEAASQTQAPHSKDTSDFSDVFTKSSQGKQKENAKPQEQSQQQQAVQAYRETQTDSQLNLGRVRDIMSTNVVTIAKTQTLGEAWDMMQRYGIYHLPVLDSAGMLCGMLSEKVILPLLMSHSLTPPRKAEPEKLPLDIFCTESLISTSPDALIKDLVPALLENDLDGVPVTTNGFLSGIVTHSDILKVVIKMQAFNVNA